MNRNGKCTFSIWKHQVSFGLKGFILQTEVDGLWDGVLLDRLMHDPTGKKYIIIDPQ